MTHALPLFSGVGIEIEWMVVDERTLDVCPIVERVLEDLAGRPAMEVAFPAMDVESGEAVAGLPGIELPGIELPGMMQGTCWSNELALHVIEQKTNGPAADCDAAHRVMLPDLARLDARLAAYGARLMPGAMHPWMDPEQDFKLWPIDEEQIYRTFDRIFDCRGHGWSNLQSMHVNLPFANDAELARLHDAVRLLLPIMPALAASSPYLEGRRAPNLDERVRVYRTNAKKIPELTGFVVPERVGSRAEYEAKILEPAYRALSAHDPERILCHEWVNSRGCIARFDRMALEIRLLDVQESLSANLALAHGVTEVLRELTAHEATTAAGEQALLSILESVVRDGDQTLIEEEWYLSALGVSPRRRFAAELWSELLAKVPTARRSTQLWPSLEHILTHGCLARRLVHAAGADPTRSTLHDVYAQLCECLRENRSFA